MSLTSDRINNDSVASSAGTKEVIPNFHDIIERKIKLGLAIGPDFSMIDRPVPTIDTKYILGLYLPATDKNPDLVWVKATRLKADHWNSSCVTFTDKLLRGAPSTMEVKRTDQVWVEEWMNKVNSSRTAAKSHEELTKTGSRLVVFREAGVKTHQIYRDICNTDIKAVSNLWLQDFNIFDMTSPNPNFILGDARRGSLAPDWATAAMISCSGDIKYLNKSRYRSCFVRVGDADNSYDPASITDKMGIGLHFSAHPSHWWSESRREKSTFDPLENKPAAGLLRNADIFGAQDDWNKINYAAWEDGQIPTLLVSRKDGKDISIHQVKALASYCDQILFSAMSNGERPLTQKEKIKIVCRKMCAEAFADFFELFREDQIGRGNHLWRQFSAIPVGMSPRSVLENIEHKVLQRKSRKRAREEDSGEE